MMGNRQTSYAESQVIYVNIPPSRRRHLIPQPLGVVVHRDFLSESTQGEGREDVNDGEARCVVYLHNFSVKGILAQSILGKAHGFAYFTIPLFPCPLLLPDSPESTLRTIPRSAPSLAFGLKRTAVKPLLSVSLLVDNRYFPSRSAQPPFTYVFRN